MKYYLTTPIYYVNAAPHIGHAYTTIAADAILRLKRMQGYNAVLTTGTDEHGQKVERSAKAAAKSPEEFTDVISNEFRQQWKTLGMWDEKTWRFQRTSNPQHHKAVQELFQRCMERGYIYKGSYTGQYCVYDELYVNEAKPGDPCPDCGRPTETVTEENYFFKLSAFREKLIELHHLHDTDPANYPRPFLQPETRRNEVLSFLDQELKDLSISRTTIKWGIPLPVEGNHVFYVWFDALTTYMSAVAGQTADGESLWPADLHLMGKEIVRFHAVYWPAFLMAADLPLPKRIFAHGWLLFENDKMSKSRGNIVRATPIQQVMGIEALRYFLLREINFGQDGSFSFDALVGRYNSDLANGLGNLLSRTVAMIHQYRGGVTPKAPLEPELASEVRNVVLAVFGKKADEGLYDGFAFSQVLQQAWSLISRADQYIVEKAPWKRFKGEKTDETAKLAVDQALSAAAQVLSVVSVILAPALPDSAHRIWKLLGIEQSLDDFRPWQLLTEDGGTLDIVGGKTIGQPEALFPRVEAGPAIERMKELEQKESEHQAELLGKKPAEAAAAPVAPAADAASNGSGEISIDDFMKVDLRVGLVESAERVKGADKLLHLKVNIGEAEPRSIVAGIALAYEPEQLINRKVVIVANLAPRKLRGLTSQGMIVAASLEGGKPVLAAFLEDVPVGARLK